MEFLRVTGGKRLCGRIEAAPAKNAVLPIIACSLMCGEEIVVRSCPRLSDIDAMLKIVRATGGRAEISGRDLVICCRDSRPCAVPSGLSGALRSSVFVLGPLLSRFGRAEVSYPGGCEIGLRPIDLHIDGLRRLGADIGEESGLIEAAGSEMKGGEVYLDFPSVGATENLMMAAVLIPGRTIIRNAAREPEVADLAGFIRAMGGRVYGAGTGTIEIEGVKKLHGCEYSPIADRIAGGTFLVACAIAGGDVTVENLDPETVSSLTEKLDRSGLKAEKRARSVRLRSDGVFRAIHKVETQPFPGFPTDMQAQLAAMLATADGCSVLVENLFENRFKYTLQLCKMGAHITVKDRVAILKGVKRLHGCAVEAEDLRGGAALVLAALGAEGETAISGVKHIDRGYERIEETLAGLGADITRITR